CAINITAKGKFTGRLQLGGGHYSMSGAFDANGHARLSLRRRNLTPLSVDLSSGSDTITGTIGDGTWTANLLARRAAFDGKTRVASQAGQYTLILEANGSSTAIPGGDSYGTASVDKAGRTRLGC